MSCACPPVVHACISYRNEHVWQELIFPQRVSALPKWEEASADNVLGLLWVARLKIGQPFKLLPVLRKKLFESVIGNMGGVFIWLAKVLKIFWRCPVLKKFTTTVNFYAIKNISIDASVYVCEAQKSRAEGKFIFTMPRPSVYMNFSSNMRKIRKHKQSLLLLKNPCSPGEVVRLVRIHM